jgi:hypothetical protein
MAHGQSVGQSAPKRSRSEVCFHIPAISDLVDGLPASKHLCEDPQSRRPVFVFSVLKLPSVIHPWLQLLHCIRWPVAPMQNTRLSSAMARYHPFGATSRLKVGFA